MVSYLNLNSQRLSEIISKIVTVIHSVKNSKTQQLISLIIRGAIWNWINKYPMQFMNLQQSGTKLEGNPDILFDVIEGWGSKKTSQKKWALPAQTMLLICCPNIISGLAQNPASSPQAINPAKNKLGPNKTKFLDGLKKSLKITKLGDTAAICFVDLYKASTYVSKNDQTNALRYIIPSIQAEIESYLFPDSGILSTGGQWTLSNYLEMDPSLLNEKQELMVDYLLSAFRLSPKKLMNSLFNQILTISTCPQIFLLVFIKTLLRISWEGKAIPWNPTLDDVKDLAPNLRTQFQNLCSFLRSYQNLKESGQNLDSKKTKATLDKLNFDILILNHLILLFKQNPTLALHQGNSAEEHIMEIRDLFTGLCYCCTTDRLLEGSGIGISSLGVQAAGEVGNSTLNANDKNSNQNTDQPTDSPKNTNESSIYGSMGSIGGGSISSTASANIQNTTVAKRAISALLVLHESQHISNWVDSLNIVRGFWEIRTAVNVTLGRTLTDLQQHNNPEVSLIVSLLQNIFERRYQFLKTNSVVTSAVEAVNKTVMLGSIQLESAFLICFSSFEGEIGSKCAICLSLLCQELQLLQPEPYLEIYQQTGATSSDDSGSSSEKSKSKKRKKSQSKENLNKDLGMLPNLVVYSQFSNASAVVSGIGGRAHQQKVIRNILRKTVVVEQGNSEAWIAMLSRWNDLTTVVLEEQDDPDKLGSNQVGKKAKLVSSNSGTNILSSSSKSSYIIHDVSLQDLDHNTPLNTNSYYQNVNSINDIRQEWHNLTGLLCALSGITVNKKIVLKSQRSIDTSSSSSVSSSSSSSSSSSYSSSDSKGNKKNETLKKEKSNSGNMGGTLRSHIVPESGMALELLSRFISSLLTLMFSDSPFIRESVVSLAASSLSPKSYSILFFNLKNQVFKHFGGSGEANFSAKSILFIDQSIALVKSILELPHNEHGTHEELSLIIYFDDIVKLFCKYTSMLDYHFYSSKKQIELNSNTLKIKKNLCGLLLEMSTKKQHISFDKQNEFIIYVCEIIMEWTTMFSFAQNSKDNEGVEILKNLKNKSNTNVDGAAKQEALTVLKLLAELDEVAMSAIANLLLGLKLENTTTIQKFFTFFSSILQNAEEEKNENLQNEKKNSNSELFPISPVVRKLTITALSNLLGANIDSGLHYFISMGYHQDSSTRAAFLKVIANILNSGAAFSSSVDPETWVDKYDKLIQLLLEDNLFVIRAFCDSVAITEASFVANLLVRIFEVNDKTLSLIKNTVATEIERTASSASLLRKNSIATKLLSGYCKIIGSRYLRETILPVLNSLLDQPNNYELDPEKLNPNEDLVVNQRTVLNCSQSFLESIVGSINICPAPIREICNYLTQVTNQYHPGKSRQTVGGFLFLRFFCPAIVAPDGFGLLSNVSDSFRRGLVLITKTLQNLASAVTFGAKEEYMTVMNPFIQNNIPVVSEYFEKISVIPSQAPLSKTLRLEDKEKEEDMLTLHRLLHQNFDKTCKILETFHNDTGPGSLKNRKLEKDEIENEKLAVQSSLERFTAIFGRLGPPPAKKGNSENSGQELNFLNIQNRTQNSSEDSVYFEEFMKQHEGQNTEKIEKKNIYYEKGTTLDGEPVYWLIPRNNNTTQSKKGELETVDYDLLLYWILKSTQFYKPFVLVIDCAFFNEENSLPQSWCVKFAKHFPEIALQNIKTIFLLFPNASTKKYSQRISRFLNSRLKKKFIIISSIEKLGTYIPNLSNFAPSSTLKIEDDIKATFTPVAKVAQYGATKEFTFRITSDFLQIITQKTYSIFSTNSTLMEIIHSTQIQDIYLSGSENSEEFLLKFESHTQKGKEISQVFKSNSKQQIMAAVKAMKARYNMANKIQQIGVQKGTKMRPLRPDDVPGILLNMSFLNLSSNSKLDKNNELRVSAYNLLTALCESFKFSVRNQLLTVSAQGLVIPPNNLNFTLKLSTILAETEVNLTQEFLLEALNAMKRGSHSKTEKNYILSYIIPWLKNLALFSGLTIQNDSQEKLEKTKNIIMVLIQFSIQEQDKSDIFNIIWQSLGEVLPLLDLIIECAVTTAVNTKDPKNQKKKSADKNINEQNYDLQNFNNSVENLKENENNNENIENNNNENENIKKSNEFKNSNNENQNLDSDLVSRTVASIIYGLASKNPKLISGKIIYKTLKILKKTSSKIVENVENHPAWFKITVFLRCLLYLSYDNLICVDLHLSEIFHIILMTFSSGPTSIRSVVHGILVNSAHSIFTQISKNYFQNSKQKKKSGQNQNSLENLKYSLQEFSSATFLVAFGLIGKEGKFDPFLPSNLIENLARNDRLDIKKVETVANSIFSFFKSSILAISDSENYLLGKKKHKKLSKKQNKKINIEENIKNFENNLLNSNLGKIWHSRWMSLTINGCFNFNPVLSSRSFLTLGVIYGWQKIPNNLTDQLISHTLCTLRNIFSLSTKGESLVIDDLLISIILCLRKMYEKLSINSKFFKPLFWISVSFIQMNNEKIFLAALEFMEVILENLDKNDIFTNNSGVSSVLMDSRLNLDPILERLDSITAIHFKTDFAFAISAHLIKGLQHKSTKAASLHLIQTFVTLALKNDEPSKILGFLPPLILDSNFKSRDFDQILTDSNVNQILVTNLNLKSILWHNSFCNNLNLSAILFSFLVTVLGNTEIEHEQLLIYEAIEYGSKNNTQILPVIFMQLFPKMENIISNSSNTKILKSVLSITESIVYKDQNQNQKFDVSFLKEIGFDGLIFQNEKNFSISQDNSQTNLIKNICCYLLETLIES